MSDSKHGLRTIQTLPPQERFEYFWMYYRFHVLAILFLIFFLSISVWFITQRQEPDLQVLLVCAPFTMEEQDRLEESFEAVLPSPNKTQSMVIESVLIPYASPETATSEDILHLIALLNTGEYPVLILNPAAAELLHSYGALATVAGVPAQFISDALCISPETLSELTLPARESLSIYRAALPENAVESLILQDAIFDTFISITE